MIECDVCGRKERLDEVYREQWFVETTNQCICSIKCFEKKYYTGKKNDDILSKI